MSIFASENTKTVEIPGAPGHTAVIQKLPGRVVERAQAEHLSAFEAGRSPRGWAAFFQTMVRKGVATEADASKFVHDPLAGYDRLTIVRGGLKSWSFRSGDEPRPVTPDAVQDLDDEALEYFAVEIMKLTKPGLFKTVAEIEADQKND